MIGYKSKLASAILLGLSLNLQAAAPQQTDLVAPEQQSGLSSKQSQIAEQFMLVTANPLASEAGYKVLQQGGNAIDAMVAVQTVLGLVEPQSSGLGGGAIMLYYDASSGELKSFDGRETAPLNATPELFLDSQGQPLKFYDAVVGGRSVGTPGTVKLLSELHQRYGSTPWAELLQPAIEQAEQGFLVSPRMASSIAKDSERLSRYEGTKQYFFDESGKPLAEGSLLKNPDYAETLKALAEQGADIFYQGEIAANIVKTVQNAEGNPGVLSELDFASYQIKERPTLCTPYREYSICSFGPPSSGAHALGQIFGTLNHFDLGALGAESPISWQLIGDASRLAFADRGRYIADSDYQPIPEGLLDTDYLASRAALITQGKALESAPAGEPRWSKRIAQADDQSIELLSTSHFVIADKQGNIISMTSTIENGFGSRLMSNGFLLNNELTDFSFVAHKDGLPVANRVEPAKRPRSSMSPTVVMKEGKPVLAIGSPGGSRIIGYVAQTIIAYLDWKMPIQAAVDMPRMVNRFGTYDIEAGSAAEQFKAPLEEMGFKVNIRDLNSGIHAIAFKEGKMISAADPRREGEAKGL